MPKQGKVPYKEIVRIQINVLENNLASRFQNELNKLINRDTISANWYNEEELALLEKIEHFYPVDYKSYASLVIGDTFYISGHFPNHKNMTERLQYVLFNKLENSELIKAMVDQFLEMSSNIEKDKDFLMGLDNKNYGENLFRYAPIIKKILNYGNLQKFSDKAKNTPPAPEAYQWKLNGISTALTYLELNKD